MLSRYLLLALIFDCLQSTLKGTELNSHGPIYLQALKALLDQQLSTSGTLQSSFEGCCREPHNVSTEIFAVIGCQ